MNRTTISASTNGYVVIQHDEAVGTWTMSVEEAREIARTLQDMADEAAKNRRAQLN